MKVLVIGSKGFIGSALCEFLKNKSVEVVESDISVDHGNNNYIQLDPVDPNFRKVFGNGNFSHCVNCSGAANVNESIKEPLRDYYLNTANVFRILDSIRIHSPYCRFINLSSAAVYGNPTGLPISEETNKQPISPYGHHKLFSEKICTEFYELFKVPTISLRIFSAYGVGLKKQLFWDIYNKANKNQRISLYGTGNESRDFVHISDLVSAIYLIMRKAEFNGTAVNIANGVEYTIAEVGEMFIEYFGKNRFLDFNGQENVGNPNNWRADISKLSSFGYKPEISLREGIYSYCEWVRSLE